MSNFSEINWDVIGVLTGIFTAIASLILWISTRIFNFGVLSNRLKTVESDVTAVRSEVQAVKVDVKAVQKDLTRQIERLDDRLSSRIAELSNRIDKFIIDLSENSTTQARSPRQLNDEGERILRQSGIGKIVDEAFDDIVTKVHAQEPKNAYQVEQMVIRAARDIPQEDAALKGRIEEGAFRSGSDVDTVAYVGAIYIRDRVLDKLNMMPTGLGQDDKPPKTKK